MSPSPRISTIIDVAVRAEVSTATVSRVLSGRRAKDDDIARRVRRAAHDLDYHANYAASTLRRDSTDLWEVTMADPTDGFCSAFLSHAITTAADHGKRVLATILDESYGGSAEGPEAVDHREDPTHTGEVDGRILLPRSHPLPPSWASTSRHAAVRSIVVSPWSPSTTLSSVCIDHASTMDLAITHLTAHGLRKTAFLGAAPNEAHEDSLRDASYLIAFESAASAVRQTTGPQWMLLGPRTTARGYDVTSRLMGTSADGPDSLICIDALVASGARLALDALHDHSTMVVAIDDHPAATQIDPRIIVLRPNFEDMARAAASLLTPTSADPPAQRTPGPIHQEVPMTFISQLVQAS